MRHLDSTAFLDAMPADRAVAANLPGAKRGWTTSAWFVSGLRWVVRLPFRIAAIRRDTALLAGLSDRELSDIGLVRQDVGDAISLPIGTPPHSLLESRAAERRQARHATLPARSRSL